MHLRNWLSHPPIGVGLGIVALLVVAFLAQKHDEAKCRDGSPNQYQTCTFEHVSQASISPIHGIEAPQRNPKPDRNEWRKESDLYAQWTMVWWAGVTAIIAGIGLAITGVGIVLVKQTLEANRAAVEAANRAIESQRKIGEAQVRAYLSISKVVGTFAKGDLYIQLTLYNSGNSPANNVGLPFEIWPGYEGPPRVHDISNWNLLLIGSLRSGGEHVETFFTGFRFNPDSVRAKITMFIRIRIVVTYTDVFGCKHYEPIAFSAGFPLHPEGTTTEFQALAHERFPWLDRAFKS